MNSLPHAHVDEVLVLGVGNPLYGDDGAGPRTVELLQEHPLPAHVHVLEAGTPGWGLPAWLEGWSSVILVDAVQMGQAPGTWRRFQPEEVRLLAQEEALSLHQPDLACGLALAQALDLLPEQLVFYGIEPADIDPGKPLSAQVSACLPEIVDTILSELGICDA